MNEARQHPRLRKTFTLTRASNRIATTVNEPRALERAAFAQAKTPLGVKRT